MKRHEITPAVCIALMIGVTREIVSCYWVEIDVTNKGQ